MNIPKISNDDILNIVLEKNVSDLTLLDVKNNTEDGIRYSNVTITVKTQEWAEKARENKTFVNLYEHWPESVIHVAGRNNKDVSLSYYRDGEIKFSFKVNDELSIKNKIEVFFDKLNDDMNIEFKKDLDKQKNKKRPRP
jgi:hypothetical protein